jgi:predicted Zn-dependent protease
MHRLGNAEQSLARLDKYVIRSPAESIESEGMRGDIAFYRGDYAQAKRRYDRGDAISRRSMDFRRGVMAANFGQFDEAAELFTRSEHASRLPSRQSLADHELARGMVEMRRGAWDKAAERFARANRLFPGSWLVEAHVAQSLALAGKQDEAIRRLETIAARTDAPEVKDALAAPYRAKGDGVRSRQWADRAGATWQTRLRQFPEAAYGHALEHELAFGTPARALDLARGDYASRPHGATAIALGWAWLANNKPTQALRAIAPVLTSEWQSADGHVVAAQAHALLGQGQQAEDEQKKALAINPHALDPAAALIWFGH